MSAKLKQRCIEAFGTSDFYTILDIKEEDRENLTAYTIRNAYLNASLKFHPDKTGDSGTTEKFTIVKEIHDRLLNYVNNGYVTSDEATVSEEEENVDDSEEESDDDIYKHMPVLERHVPDAAEEIPDDEEVPSADGEMSDDEEVVPDAEDEMPDEEEVGDENQYVVEKILGKRGRGKKIEYLIKWEGFNDEENTWEPVANCDCPDLIEEYEAECALKKQKSKGRPKETRGTRANTKPVEPDGKRDRKRKATFEPPQPIREKRSR